MKLIAAGFLISGLLFSITSFGQEEPKVEPAVQHVSTFLNEAMGLYTQDLDDQALHGELCTMVDKHAATDRMSQIALGRHKSVLTEERREEFHAAFRAMLAQKLDGAFSRFKNNKVVIEKFARAVDDAFVVNVNVTPPNRPTSRTQFFVLLDDEENGRVFDASIGGVRMITLLKGEFDRLISRNGLDGLMEFLKSHPPCP